MENKETNKGSEEIIGQVDPSLLLQLNERKTQVNSRLNISEPVKLLGTICLIDLLYVGLASLITGRSHFILGQFILIPWPMALLDGLILVGYGIFVMKRKYGEVDFSISSHGGDREVKEIKGDAAVVLAWVYIALGILLLVGPLLQFFSNN